MKICFLTTSFPAYHGHVQSPFILSLAENVVKQNNLVTVVCPYYKKSQDKKENYNGVEIRRFQFMFRKWQTITEGEGISSFMKSIGGFIQGITFISSMFFKGFFESKNSDVIHCQWSLSSIPGYLISRIRKIPYIITLRGEDVTLAKNKLFKFVQGFLLKRASYIISNNQSLLDAVKKIKGDTPAKVIFNGVDLYKFSYQDKKESRKKCNLPENGLMVYFVGWLIKRKGINYLLEAWSKLENSPNFLVITGEGPLEKELKNLTKKLKIENSVIFTGKIHPNNISNYYAATDIFILPSLAEGMPNVVMEAMAAGKAVIATNVNGTPQLVGDTGILIPACNSDEIKNSINILTIDDDKRKKLGKDAKKRIIDMGLTWESSAKKYITIYDKVLKVNHSLNKK